MDAGTHPTVERGEIVQGVMVQKPIEAIGLHIGLPFGFVSFLVLTVFII